MLRLLLFAVVASLIGSPPVRAQTAGKPPASGEPLPAPATAEIKAGEVKAPPDTEPTAGDGSRYFVIVFGSESVPKRARYTHTWASMIKATPDPAAGGAYQLEVSTISWMPRNLVIRPLALRPECGVNLSLEATLHDCFCKGECVCMWGPYEFDPEVAPHAYERVQKQIARLNSGCVLYKCIDPDDPPRSNYISDCIHAVTDLDRHLPRPFYNEFQNFGMDASRRVVMVLAQRDRFDPRVKHDWLADALGIDPRVRRANIR
jgi:hypothetical protein